MALRGWWNWSVEGGGGKKKGIEEWSIGGYNKGKQLIIGGIQHVSSSPGSKLN